MTKYFCVSTDLMSSEQTKALKEAIGKAGWWHWLPNFWLVKDTSGTLSVTSIRDAIYEISSKTRCVVLEVNPETWAALTKPDEQGRDMADWIRKNWIKPKSS